MVVQITEKSKKNLQPELLPGVTRKSKLYAKEHRTAYLFILAPVLGFLIFTVGPALYSLYGSFTDWNGLGQMNFIGLDNYTQMLTEERFWKAGYNTIFMMIGIPIGLFLALLLAMGLNKGIKGTNTFRVIYYIPVVSSVAAISILWQWVYNGDFGLLNQVLELIGIDGPNWLQNVKTIKPAIMIMSIWKGLGYSMLLYLAALQNVSKSYYEAAKIDGANAFQCFKSITIPMVRPVTFFMLVTSIIGGSQMFVEPNIMTVDGGPMYSAGTMVYYLWQKAFGNFQMGYASAIAWTLGVFVLIVTLIQFKINEKYE